MATKGAGNHYGNARGGKKGQPTIHTSFSWAKGFNKSTLKQHFSDHGEQMGCSNQNEYAAKAVHFANMVDRKNCVSFIDKNNSTYKYSKSTNEFAIIKNNGVIIT